MSGHEEPIESGRVADIARSQALYEQMLRFQWEYYSELAYQRTKIYDSLKSSLVDRAKPFEFSRWQRAAKYKYALEPLSTKGSLLDPGGRFNIGAIATSSYPVFPALYVASDRDTAITELLGQATAGSSLSPEDLALTRRDSITVVSVSGKLDAVLDISDQSNLVAFVELIKGFRVSSRVSSMAKSLNIALFLIKTAQELADNLQAPEWRQWPTLWDAPAPPQIFGRIVLDAQIDGILYNSVLTKKPCLCLYHQNFQNSPSYVELDDPEPSGVVQRKLDATNCAG